MARFTVVTFGCQMNVHDSERLEEVLCGAGYGRVPAQIEPYDADVIVLNTCSVRDKAEQKLRSEVGRLTLLKKNRPAMLLVVAGCMAQQEGKRLLDRFPAIDLVIGPDNIGELPALLAEADLGGPPQVRTVFDVDAPRFLTAPLRPSSDASTASARRRAVPTAFVTTMKGCNERCSFCVVPYTRGPERYRPSQEIIEEIEQLTIGGVREVTLLGQTVNSYRDPSRALALAPAADPNDPDESEFASLLRAIAERVPALIRVRYASPHPRHLTPSLIAAHRDLTLLPRHVHMPVQSGSNRILKRMIRRYTREEYIERIGNLRDAVPGMTLSTDMIVGFCGETEDDFEQTLSLAEQLRFAGMFAFKYSVRPNTPALKMKDDVPESVKSERLARLFEVSERTNGEHLATLVGSKQHVLVEGPSKTRRQNLTGRSERNEIVHIENALDVDIVGEVVEAEIVEAYKHSLLAVLTPAARRRARPASAVQRRSLPLV